MSLLLILYIVNSLVLILLGYHFLKRYQNLGGFFFFIFNISTSLWFIFYSISFFSTSNTSLLLLYGKLAYFLSIISLYSFLLFLIYFKKGKEKIISPLFWSFWIIFFGLGFLYIKTPAIINGLYYNTEQNDWYESIGFFYNFHLFLSILFLPLSVFLSYYRLSRLSSIDRKRFQYILAGMVIFLFLTILFLLIFPLFGIFTLEKYIALFLLPFIIGVFYSIRRYDFLNSKLTFLSGIIFLISFIGSYGVILVFRRALESHISQPFQNYWGISNNTLFTEFFLGIVYFLGIHFIMRKKIFSYLYEDEHSKALEKLKNQIPFILNIQDLNSFLSKEFNNKFHINGLKIIEDIKNVNSDIKIFFETYPIEKYFLNDISFIEENKHKIGKYGDYNTIDTSIYIIFPLRNNNNELIGSLELGSKKLQDPFLTSEIQELIFFTHFIQGHLKYMRTYKKLQDLSINLDKKVDEKTIEFNTLVAKQKEFIGYISHEIKNPITNCIFLSESLEADLSGLEQNLRLKKIKEDQNILSGELGKISQLVKHIFSTEQFDLEKVKIYKKNINLYSFLEYEISSFKKSHPDIAIQKNMVDVGSKEIDELQMRQVIQNLLTNAKKFADIKNPEILVSLQKTKGGVIKINIEDNGKGFNQYDTSSIFEKYTTGKGSSVGLGLGLYLCKKIVENHKGSICAGKSETLHGACICIQL